MADGIALLTQFFFWGALFCGLVFLLAVFTVILIEHRLSRIQQSSQLAAELLKRLLAAAPRTDEAPVELPQVARHVSVGMFLLAGAATLVGILLLVGIVRQTGDHPQITAPASSATTKASQPANAPAWSSGGMPLGDGRTLSTMAGWRIVRDKSDMDGSPEVILARDAENEIRGAFGKTGKPVLYIRCREKKLEAYVYTGMQADTDDIYGATTVRVRLDEKPAERRQWTQATSHDALFASGGGEFIGHIAASEQMLVEFRPYASGSQVVKFDVRGLDQTVAEAGRPCGWDWDQQGYWKRTAAKR